MFSINCTLPNICTLNIRPPYFPIDKTAKGIGPGGGGKIPINPQYLLNKDEQLVSLRNYEGKKFNYPQPNQVKSPLL